MPLTVTPSQPITDPNDPNYDATKDPNSAQYKTPDTGTAMQPEGVSTQPPTSAASQPATEAEAPPEGFKADQSRTGGMPGATSETSSQMPKEGESTSEGGKSPLKFDPNAPAVDTVAQKDQMQVEGAAEDDKPIGRQIHSSQIPVDRPPEKAWQDFMLQAIQGLYPHLRNGVDFAVGRKKLDGDMELLSWDDKFAKPDMGAVEKAAKELAGSNPYGSNYKARPSLAAGQSQGEEVGEVHREWPNRELPPDTAQSEVNPNTNAKVPSQAYPGANGPTE